MFETKRPNKGLARKAASLTTAICAVLVLGGWDGCEPPPLNNDPGFDIWCGKKLCAWKTEQGSIKRVATWHRADYGVELVGDKVTLSQLLTTDTSCFQFDLQADRDDNVILRLQMDFRADGTVEYDHALVSDDFSPVSYKVTAPTWYDGKVKVTVRKIGDERAVLTNIRLRATTGCAGPAMELDDRPAGVECKKGSQCTDKHCLKVMQVVFEGAPEEGPFCSQCTTDSDCNPGKVCSIDGKKYGMYRACIPRHSRVMGQRCLADSDCASKTCCHGVCSQCCDNAGCSAQTTCEQYGWTATKVIKYSPFIPFQCSPGLGTGATGAQCWNNHDCASGYCKGPPLKMCAIDGRSCTENKDCLGVCTSFGISGGECL